MNCVAARVHLAGREPPAPWAEAGAFLGYELVALDNYRSLIEESVAMENCVDRYSGRIHRSECRLYSLRRDGRRIATLELIERAERCVLAQIKGPGNGVASDEVLAVAERWVAVQKRIPPRPMRTKGRPQSSLDAELSHLLEPYRRDRERHRTWLGQPKVWGLEAGLADVALRAGITSWPFRLLWEP
jgi:hypothetical protein